MSIELKYRFKYHFTVISIAALSLFLGIVGIFYGIEGFIMLPVISAFLAALISIEKRRIASITVSAVLVLFEIVIGFMSYFTVVSLSSILVAVVISTHYLKKREKNDSAVIATLITAIMIFVAAVLYIFSTTDVVKSLPEAYEYFLGQFELFKQSTINLIISMAGGSNMNNGSLSPEYMNEIFDAYLSCIVAIVAILAFFLVGLSHKIFTGLIRNYSRNPDDVDAWRFMPSSVFAYFYFALALLSFFAMDTESVLSLSIANLYLIFMFVFAYVGFKFASVALNKNGRSTFRTTLAVLALTVLFSSLAVQILAAVGAFVAAYRSKFFKNHNISDN